ncbi:phytase [Idiomarina sp. M1R2S28]|uniref:Phytase n=1 Tax=Idiomarina rhizosphaerae TaxID=2961572 RepID=A0A9X2JRI9_9GAMM|nr:phytase [Idiomarina rhizosphaerae]MCP1338249.1 phytase [Idiomarina rhizosphaerae]
MRNKMILSAVASSLMLLAACGTSASETNVRHKVAVNNDYLKVTADGLSLGDKRVAEGDFFHLRTLPLSNGEILIGAMEGNTQELVLWRASGKAIQPVWKGEITSRVVEDICFYESNENQQLSVFLLGGRGGAEQRLLKQDEQWLKEPLVVRNMNVPFDSTACAVSNAEQKLYVAEADQAVWAYNAEPEVDQGRDLIAAAKPFGVIEGEVKALELLDDGSLLVLEEEPPRLLVYRQNEQGFKFDKAFAIDGAEALTDVSDLGNGELLLTEEDMTVMSKLTIDTLESKQRPVKKPVSQVEATLQTEPSPLRGDAIDDPAVWVHPEAPGKSRILATDKRTGLYVYDMSGNIVQELPVGRLNNVDVRGSWAVASLRDNNSLQLFDISADGGLSVSTNILTDIEEIYGLCMGYNEATEQASVYVNGKSGVIQQFVISNDGKMEKVRELSVPSQPEGCVVDDKTQRLFVGEEDVAVWLFDAAGDGSTSGEAIINVDQHEELVADIEGVTFASVDGRDLLFLSSQGNDSYIVFEGQAPWSLLSHFRIRTNTELAIDGASETDGIDVTTQSLGKGFEQGAFIVQDGRNRMPEAGQNLKLVPLENILKTIK